MSEVTSRTVELPAGTKGFHRAVVSCPSGMPDGNEVRQGFADYSMPVSGNRWYVDGLTLESTANKVVALEQCIR